MNPSKSNIKIIFIALGLLGCFTKSILAFEDNVSARAIDEIKIKHTVKIYADAYLNADAKSISTVFDPDTILLSVEDGKLEKTTMKQWIQNLNARKKKGDLRTALLKIVSINITNHTATVKLSLTFKDTIFTDYLSLLLLDHQWKIVGKIYDVDTLKTKLNMNEAKDKDSVQNCHLDVCYKNGHRYCCSFGSNQ